MISQIGHLQHNNTKNTNKLDSIKHKIFCTFKYTIKKVKGCVLLSMPIIPDTWEAEIKKIV
jgi:hypothetical protein